jgi:threonine aldolase
MADIAELTDVFYIGGTKNGALLGEALVICRMISGRFPLYD